MTAVVEVVDIVDVDIVDIDIVNIDNLGDVMGGTTGASADSIPFVEVFGGIGDGVGGSADMRNTLPTARRVSSRAECLTLLTAKDMHRSSICASEVIRSSLQLFQASGCVPQCRMSKEHNSTTMDGLVGNCPSISVFINGIAVSQASSSSDSNLPPYAGAPRVPTKGVSQGTAT